MALVARGLLLQTSTHAPLNKAGIGDIQLAHFWPQDWETPWGVRLSFDCTAWPCVGRSPAVDLRHDLGGFAPGRFANQESVHGIGAGVAVGVGSDDQHRVRI